MNNIKYSRRSFLRQNIAAGAGILLGSGLPLSSYAKTLNGENQGKISLSLFDLDATPPIGQELAYNQMTNSWDLGLRAKGVVLHGAGKPIVLCAIDWIGISNEGYDAFRATMAKAAGTIPERVTVHAIHQHDSVRCDFGAEKILIENGVAPKSFEGSFARDFLTRLKEAIEKSVETTVDITHIGLGEANILDVASNRRILGEDGLVKASRMSSCRTPALRAEPEGLIDPVVSLVSFWNEDKPLAVLSYYAVHPQSYYRTGIANPDFPGVARFLRQLAVPEALHIHFNGAAGDVAAGKYNDGSKENRLILAERMAEGMKKAWENTKKEKITAGEVFWKQQQVAFTPAPYLANLKKELENDPSLYEKNVGYARKMAWYERCLSGKKVDISCLGIGKARILHLPAESFVDYQLSAKKRRPDLFVAVAAYGEYGPGYIGTEKAYEEGGYETSEVATNVHPETERVFKPAIFKLLDD